MVTGLLGARLTKGQMELETMADSSLSSFAGNPTLAKHSLLGAFKWPPHKKLRHQQPRALPVATGQTQSKTPPPPPVSVESVCDLDGRK